MGRPVLLEIVRVIVVARPNTDQDAALAYFVGRLPPEALKAAIEAARKQ